MTGILITVRSNSKRLPQKAVREIRNIKIIEYLIGRIKHADTKAGVCICTTDLQEDSVFDGIADKAGVKVFHGSAENIIKRHYDCAMALGYNFIVNVDGDDVFCSPDAVAEIIGAYNENPYKYDIIKTTDLPFGTNATGYKINVLEKILSANSGRRIETGWGNMLSNEKIFNILNITHSAEMTDDARLTLDYDEDFEVFQKLIEALGMDKKYVTQNQIITYIKANPDIREINSHLKEQYFENLYEKQKEEGHSLE